MLRPFCLSGSRAINKAGQTSAVSALIRIVHRPLTTYALQLGGYCGSLNSTRAPMAGKAANISGHKDP